LAGGGYAVKYFNGNQVSCYGNADIVTYSPNRGNTNGVQVRPFATPPPGGATTVGIHAIVKVQIPGGEGAVAPLHNAVAFAAIGGSYAQVKTNGNGYFSIYYDNDNPNIFWNSQNHPTISVSGVYGGCSFSGGDPGPIWIPDDNPASASYYANERAEADLGTLILTTTVPGCTP